MQNARDFLVSHRDHIDVGVIMDLNQSFYKLPKCLWYYFGMFNFELNPILNKMKCQVLFCQIEKNNMGIDMENEWKGVNSYFMTYWFGYKEI